MILLTMPSHQSSGLSITCVYSRFLTSALLPVLHLELCVRREPDLHPVHDALSGQTGSAATGGHQGGVCPGRLHDGAVGPDLCGGPTFPGPQAHLKGQQEHRRAQSKITSAPS